MRPFHCLSLVLVLSAAASAGEGLINTYLLDSNGEPYRLTLKENWSFELAGPGGQQATGTYVASDRKIGLLAGNLLRHFEYQLQNGDLLLRPSATDGPEPNNMLGQMPPTQRGEAFTTYLSDTHYRQKYALRPVVQPPVVQPTVVQPTAAGALTLDQLLTQEQMNSQYHAYMAAGSKAFGEKRYSEARAHFILAKRFKANATEPGEQIALCNGVMALAEGDAARQRGDVNAAREAYTRARQAAPALAEIADAQLGTATGFQLPVIGQPPVNVQPPVVRPTMDALDAGIAQRLRLGRSDEALQMAMSALQADPTSLRLRTLKEGLEGLQTAEGLYQNLSTILGRARTQCDTIQNSEQNDNLAAQLSGQLATQGQQVEKRLAAARNRLVENPYAGLGSTLTDARGTANETADLLDNARAACAEKAAAVVKDNQVDLPFVTIKLDKNNKRVKALNSCAEGLKALAAEAAALAK